MEPKKDQLSTFKPKDTHMQIKVRLKKKKKERKKKNKEKSEKTRHTICGLKIFEKQNLMAYKITLR